MIPRPWTMRGLPSWVLAWWSLGLLALLVNANPDDDEPHYVSSWDSSPFNLKDVTDNNLGLMAKACSESYCHAGINGLDLWESLVEVCVVAYDPSLSDLSVHGIESGGAWSPVIAGMVCGLTAAAGVVFGYHSGSEMGQRRKDHGVL